jgi:hypothetical protein
MNIVYVHGHAASMKCFTYIRKHIGHHKEILLEYNSNDGFASNYADMRERVQSVRDIFSLRTLLVASTRFIWPTPFKIMSSAP